MNVYVSTEKRVPGANKNTKKMSKNICFKTDQNVGFCWGCVTKFNVCIRPVNTKTFTTHRNTIPVYYDVQSS